MNSNAPSFVQRLRVSFRFEEVQRLAVRFYDVDTDHIASVRVRSLVFRYLYQYLDHAVYLLCMKLARPRLFSMPSHHFPVLRRYFIAYNDSVDVDPHSRLLQPRRSTVTVTDNRNPARSRRTST